MFGAYDWLWIAVVLATTAQRWRCDASLGRRRMTASGFAAMLLK
ncbi:MAG: hypothetical protein R3C56_26025 [Pirellulaceae bacterium]